jgi:predicted membrane chloride channel (bestrophin family)
VALAYPLTFTVRAYPISGRDTRVHLGASVGVSLVFASVWSLVSSSAMGRKLRRASFGALSVLLALLVGFGVVVRKNYARAWELQQLFWTSLVPAVPDLEDGTVVLVDPSRLPDTWYIAANTGIFRWSLTMCSIFLALGRASQRFTGCSRTSASGH